MRTVFCLAALFIVSFAPSLARTSPNVAPTAVPTAPPVARPMDADLARSRVDAMLRGGRADASFFAASFLAQVTVDQVNAILAQLGAALGTYERIEGSRGVYLAHFARGTNVVLASLDADGRMSGLFFKPPKFAVASLDDAFAQLRTSAGTLSYVLIEGGSERAALEPAARLAVGSTFKLAVLAALQDQIAGGRRHWTDVVALDKRLESLPSGILRTWPDGTPITLASYAAEMISISDNMAADTLVRLLGADALAPYAFGNVPFLTTREAVTLKSSGAATQLAAYLAARTAAERSTILAAVDELPLPAIGEQLPQPVLAVEWHYDVRTLCGLMGRVAQLPLMAINPGVADPSAFRTVAYKGGSDVGAINLTTQVVTKRGTVICFSATLNDAARALDENAFTLAYGTVLGALESH